MQNSTVENEQLKSSPSRLSLIRLLSVGAATMRNPAPIHSAGLNSAHSPQHMGRKSKESAEALCGFLSSERPRVTTKCFRVEVCSTRLFLCFALLLFGFYRYAKSLIGCSTSSSSHLAFALLRGGTVVGRLLEQTSYSFFFFSTVNKDKGSWPRWSLAKTQRCPALISSCIHRLLVHELS